MDGALELALHEVAQYNLDLGVFQDTKVTDGIHMRAPAVYHVFVTNTLSRHRRGGSHLLPGLPPFQSQGAESAWAERAEF